MHKVMNFRYDMAPLALGTSGQRAFWSARVGVSGDYSKIGGRFYILTTASTTFDEAQYM